METHNTTPSLFELVKTIGIVIIAVCSIILVIQGFGGGTQDVYVRGGDIDADVSGSVSVDNAVDVNLQYINGQRNVFFNNPSRGDKDKYYLDIAETIAERGTCLRNNYGSVIVKNDEIMAETFLKDSVFGSWFEE